MYIEVSVVKMKVYHLARQRSILNKFLSEIRDKKVQKDSMRFRRNIERIGEILGYELSKNLNYSSKQVITPLGAKPMDLLSEDIVLCSILRAGLPLHNGLLNYFDDAENAFISAYRHHPNNDEEFEIVVEYFASPTITNKTLLLIDPMLATGRSLVSVYEALKKYGNPKQIHIVSVIGSLDGIDFIKNHFPVNTSLWIADIDNKLNNKGYILPGLGDAGDLAFGEKM
ncbi:Uracil phosphoribosyltransferase [Tenacibaculum sp. 190524A05c]